MPALAALATAAMLAAGAAAAQPAVAADAPPPAPATTPPADPPMVAARLQPDEKLRVDGRLDHPAWQRAPVYDRFVEVEPVRGRTPGWTTRVRLLYDERALYVGIEALDPEPTRIRAPLVRHDQVNRTQDFVVLYLDPIGARKAAQFFRVNAAGSTGDGLHTADDDTEDFAPDFDFDAGSVRTPEGYSVVIRVPYSSLRYSGDPHAQWRVMVGRRIPREQVNLALSVALPLEALSFIDRLQPLAGFEPPGEHGFVQWRPTLTLRRTEDKPFGSEPASRTELKPSLDVKWRARPELVLDATLNPDFSQVALDTPQLSRNNRFALFYPEKRPFFLESADLLAAPTRSLYTRTVNDPRWGLRASWRSDAAAGSALLVRDRGGGLTPLPGVYGTGYALQPANDTLLARGGLRVGEDWSFGAVAAERRYRRDDLADDAGRNTVAGVDGQWTRGAWRVKAQLLGSRTTALPDGTGGLAAGAAQGGRLAHLHLLRRSDSAETDVLYEDSTAGFRNDAGFLTQAGVRHLEATQKVSWRNLGPLNAFELSLYGLRTEDRQRNQTAQQKWSPGVYLVMARNTEVEIDYTPAGLTRIDADSPLRRERYWHLWAQTTPVEAVPLAQVELSAGRLLDVGADTVRQGQRWILDVQTRPLARLELQPRLELLSLRSEGRLRWRESAAQLLAIWHLQARQSLRLILQRSRYYRDAEPARGLVGDRGGSDAQSLTYAWRRSAGTVLYVGVNRGVDALPNTPDRSTEVFAKLQLDWDELRR